MDGSDVSELGKVVRSEVVGNLRAGGSECRKDSRS